MRSSVRAKGGRDDLGRRERVPERFELCGRGEVARELRRVEDGGWKGRRTGERERISQLLAMRESTHLCTERRNIKRSSSTKHQYFKYPTSFNCWRDGNKPVQKIKKISSPDP